MCVRVLVAANQCHIHDNDPAPAIRLFYNGLHANAAAASAGGRHPPGPVRRTFLRNRIERYVHIHVKRATTGIIKKRMLENVHTQLVFFCIRPI